MGVSIHYRGQIADPIRIKEFQRHLIEFAGRAKWECLNLTGQEESRILEIILYPPEHCEPVFFLLDSQGRLRSPCEVGAEAADDYSPWCSVKTQYGPLKAHVQIAELLKQIQREYILDLEVSDEGSYWETESIEHLRAAREFLTHQIDLLSETLRSVEADPSDTSPKQLCEVIEQAAKQSPELEKRRLQ